MNDRPRLCFVVESGTDVRLIEGLAARYHLTVLARRIEGGREISQPTTAAVEVVTGPPGRGAFAWFAGRQLLSRTFDHVISQGYGPASVAANVAAALTRTPTSMLVCSPSEHYYRCRRVHPNPDKPFRRRELAAIRAVARANAWLGDRYVVLSKHLEDVVRTHGANQPIAVVPVYGIDQDIFRPRDRDKQELRDGLALPTSGHLVFYSSRVAPEKDGDTLLLALRKLVDAGRDVRVLHCSGGHAEFEALADRLDVADWVISRPAVHPHHELADLYRASDLCVQASRAEGLGFSPIEALACEIPVVATAVGGLLETVVAGKTGWSYPPGDVAALAAAIAQALDDPAEAARRAQAGRRLVVARYGRRHVFDQLDAVVRAA